ncbi:MAG: hypothetical protein IPO87_16620 [Flavobacteriales bacterium]|nr:hypothetical protein [Flavobacteriales bacterium]
MQLKLSQTATARFGVHAKRMEQGSMALIQSSAIMADGAIEHAYIDRTDPALVNYKDTDILRKDDVLLIGKGAANTAAVWPGSTELTLASGMLFVIRPNPEMVHPAFLAEYLNSLPAQAQMAMYRKTGSVSVPSRKALDHLLVPVPTLGEQHKLVQLANAAKRAKLHLNELTNAYSQLLDAVWANHPGP